ncbi:heme peroxidase-domain-containing protein [Fusarium redolens]|uniref:Heme peroxidase-domain-containing protein n=1 Tax=Fusarium redolens TaxID=48865 RepID=A0A9P9HK17_FUSRE|nr:heme peroxidase-domain-containing protein [Fusarium redolens]KAH7258995.1 heme peroxidase-domain-containing protein [Fusarium redolens]
MSSSTRALFNGNTGPTWEDEVKELNKQLKEAKYLSGFHGDALIGDKFRPQVKWWSDLGSVLTFKNIPAIKTVLIKYIQTRSLDKTNLAQLVGSVSNDSILRAKFIETEVKNKYERMLHPPVTYLGDAFKYRTADGKFNSAMHPQLGQAGAPYAKTVPSKTHPLGALPDPADLFDRLMARQDPGPDGKGRPSTSGLSSMLIYHATIIIHDIFRTNDSDKNISDSSSYLDLSPLYGFTDEMQRKVRDDKYKLGLLKPDTFAEDRLLRQPPGVCIYLVMYNRYHNYVATQLRRINENGRFSVPTKFLLAPLASAAKEFVKPDPEFQTQVDMYHNEWKRRQSAGLGNDKVDPESDFGDLTEFLKQRILKGIEDGLKEQRQKMKDLCIEVMGKDDHKDVGDKRLKNINPEVVLEEFLKAHAAAWDKLDEDLFQTARLITCGMYIQISIHDYLRALMGFHNFDTNFTLDPRVEMKNHKNVSRGLGNQVTVEFNLLYRFHCAISMKDERYAETFMKELFEKDETWNPKDLNLPQFMGLMQKSKAKASLFPKPEPWQQEFGVMKDGHPDFKPFKRNEFTGLFDDKAMVEELTSAMDDPIANFGPLNVPRCLRAVEVLGIMQARKWEIGTLNDFRDFFGMKRHDSFESITPNEKVQNALRDLYEHPDKVELYPGVFCETNQANGQLNADPGPSDLDSALWAAIFSDAITLVRSDRFYTVDWNTNSLTNWGMKEVTPDSDVLKSSMFHRLIQRAFPEWYPYDSIRFFHPFYTAEKNAELAKQQGYDKEFSMKTEALRKAEKNSRGEMTKTKYHTAQSDPQRPSKTIYLTNREDIKLILEDTNDILVHPARTRISDLPKEIHDVLKPGQNDNPAKNGAPQEAAARHSAVDHEHVMSYLIAISRNVIKREVVTMEKGIYQLDIVRDFAIPVVTRYVADFLGFGHLLRSDTNSDAPYSENEVYQHINNCQVFLSYNTDETKLLKRRKAFRDSMGFLLKLTEEGNVKEAGRWKMTRWFGSVFGALGGKKENYMEALGYRVATEIIEREHDTGKAAAILLLTGLDSAYNVVLAFTSTMESFFNSLYAEKPSPRQQEIKSLWLKVQSLAFDDEIKSIERIQAIVLKVQRWSVRLPVIRKASQDTMIQVHKRTNDKPVVEVAERVKVLKGTTVVCDINRAEQKNTSETPDEREELNYCSSFAEAFSGYHPKHVAATGLVTMIKVLAQLQNLRRGHDTQGVSKKVSIDASCVGYANYMAPMRLKEIELKVKEAKKSKGLTDEEVDAIFPSDIRKPATATYLTPEWDEMVPFPTTWKMRFDGYGVSDYSTNDWEALKVFKVPDDIQPFYQPNGPSHIGGSFATPVCVCHGSWKDKDRAKEHEHLENEEPGAHEVLAACGHAHAPQPATSGCKIG